jgi:hypothetical protein
MEMVESVVPLRGARVLEIGAGYGRTAHAMLASHPIGSYTIIDLPSGLELSRRYLKTVLPKKDFSKLIFVPNTGVRSIQGEKYDLCINIDSFAEMEKGTVRAYLELIDSQCHALYVQNPVGKYKNEHRVAQKREPKRARFAMESGLLRDVIDIDDSRSVRAQVKKFLHAYRPGVRWRVARHGWARPWSFYWHAVFLASKRDARRGRGA